MISAQADMGDHGFRNKVEEPLGEAQASPENGDENDGSDETLAFSGLEGSFHVGRSGRQTFGHLRNHETRDIVHQIAKLLAAAPLVSQPGEAVGDQGVFNYVHSSKGFTGRSILVSEKSAKLLFGDAKAGGGLLEVAVAFFK